MKLVYRQVIGELAGPFAFGVMAFTSVTFAGTHLLKVTNWLLAGRIDIVTAVWFVLLVLPSIIVFTLPMSTLLAVLLGIGRLSSASEIVALFAGGISIYRLAVPVIAMGVIVSAGSIALNEVIVPWAHGKQQEIQAVVFREEAPTQTSFAVEDDAMNLHIVVKDGIDPDTGTLRNVWITQFAESDGEVNGVEVREGQPMVVAFAARAEWGGLHDKDGENRYKWKLYDGWWQMVGTDSPAMSSFTKSQTREIKMGKTPDQFALYQKAKMRNTDQLSFTELTRMVAYLKEHPSMPMDKIRELDVNRWNKFALPLSSLVFALLAAPLAIRPTRSTSSAGYGLSIVLILLYWIVWHFTSHLAIQGNLAPPIGAFAADALGVLTAAVLLRNAAK